MSPRGSDAVTIASINPIISPEYLCKIFLIAQLSWAQYLSNYSLISSRFTDYIIQMIEDYLIFKELKGFFSCDIIILNNIKKNRDSLLS